MMDENAVSGRGWRSRNGGSRRSPSLFVENMKQNEEIASVSEKICSHVQAKQEIYDLDIPI